LCPQDIIEKERIRKSGSEPNLHMSIIVFFPFSYRLSKYARIPPSSAGGMNGLPSPLGGEG